MMRARGFTLVELLVAISILAMVAVLGWRGLDGIVRARLALTEQMETTRGMQLAFAQMQSDCEHMADSAIMDKRPFLLADNDRMTLVRTVVGENEPARLAVVAYRVQNGVLTRRESLGTRDLVQLDVVWKAVTSDTDSNTAVTLQSGVGGMTVQTYQNGVWREGPPPAQGQTALDFAPTGMQVALQVNGMVAPMRKAFLLGSL